MRILLTLITIILLGFPPVQSLSSPLKQTRLIAMITWRGETQAEKGFQNGLEELGYHPEYLKFHCNQNPDLLYRALAVIEKQKVDLIYVFGTTATCAVLKRVTHLPVIFNIVTRPVASGIISDWGSSGNNAAGVSSKVPIEKQIRALEKVIRFSRLGVIYSPLEKNSVIQTEELEQLASAMKFDLIPFKVTDKKDVKKVLANIEDKVDAVFLPSDSTIKTLGKAIMSHVNAAKLPSLAALEEMVTEDGAMMGLSPNYYHLGRLAARKAHLVFQGSRPSQLTSVTSEHFNITLNLGTAKKIGIHLPTGLLVMADKIIR